MKEEIMMATLSRGDAVLNSRHMKDALESVPCEVYSVDDLKGLKENVAAIVELNSLYDGKEVVKILTRDNVHTWARENGGPIEITDEMVLAGAAEVGAVGSAEDLRSEFAAIYAAMEAKRRESK